MNKVIASYSVAAINTGSSCHNRDNISADCIVTGTRSLGITSNLSPFAGLYSFENKEDTNIIIVNASDQEHHLKRGEVLDVFDAIDQEPIEMFKPEDKWTDVELDTIF